MLSSLAAAALLTAACGSDVPRSQKSGFDMAKHSLAFENFANGYPDAVLDAAGMQRMFGAGVCLDSGRTPCTLTAKATQWMKRANAAMAGGRCEGFAVLSSLFAQGTESPSDFGAADARALVLRGNTPLQRELAYWFSTQLVPEVVAKATVSLKAKDAMPFLAKALAPDAKERYRLGIVKKVGTKISGGHAVTPFGYYADPSGNGTYWVRVYDNNNPDSERLLKIDTRANRWEFEAARSPKQKSSLYFGDDSNGNLLYFSPINVRRGTLPCSFCGTGSGVTVTTGGGLEATLTSGASSVGLKDGAFSGSGGVAMPSFSSDLDQEEASAVLRLDSADGDLLIQLSGSAPGDDATSATTQSLEAIGPRFAMGLSGLKLDATAADAVAVTGNGSTIRYDNDSRTPLILSAQVDLMNGKSLEVAVSTNGSDRVEARVDPNSGAVKVEAIGTTGEPVTVAITQTNGDGTTQQGQFTFAGSDAGTLDVTTSTWMPGQPLNGTVDTGGGPTTLIDSCIDGAQNGMESDVDCGQVCETKCALAQKCAVGADCGSGVCATNGTCTASACTDGRKSGAETDVDCGGTACAACVLGKTCVTDADCTSGACRLGACVATWAVGFAVTGLPPGNSVELTNAGEAVTVSADASYVFPTRTTGPYAVTVTGQPLQAVCTVANGSGTATANVGNIVVTCVRRYAIGGTLTGLAIGQSVVLQNNGGDDLSLNLDTAFTFPTLVGGAYSVTVLTQPAGQVCTVTGGANTATADVTTVQVGCISGFTLGGTVAGLGAAEQVSVRNGTETRAVTMNGAFSFTNLVMGAYDVQVVTPPAGKRCVVVNASGTAAANVTNVQVLCAASGALDLTFNSSGFFTTPTSPNVDYLVNLLLNPDGTLVGVGQSDGAGSDVDWVVLKLRADGTPDPAFGSAGVAIVSTAVGFESARAIFRDGTGYLIVGTMQGADPDLGIARLNANGTLDLTFGTNGYRRFDHGQPELYEDVVQDAQGRFVAVGRRGTGPHDVVVARLNSNGTLDTTFGTLGYFDSGGPADESATAVAIDPATSAIFVAAEVDGVDSLILKLDATGAPVTGFGSSGALTLDLSGAGRNEWPYDLAVVQGDLYVAGRASGPVDSDLAMARLSGTTGALQAAFGTGGRLLVDRGGNETAFALTPIAGGGFYLGGDGSPLMTVVRVTAAGAVDPTFANNGVFEQAISGSAVASHLTVDAAGRLLISGTIRATGNADVGVVRIFP